MATADRRLWPVTVGLPLLAVAGVAALSVVAWRGSSPAPEPEPFAVEATDAQHFTSLDDLTRGSDLVVTGRVESTARGRLVGDPATGGVVSRFVTLRIDDVLWSPAGGRHDHVVVEEEGWLADGTAIAVNGLAPSAEGDEGLWFLDRVDTSDEATYVVVNEQGRYLDRSGRSVGADRADALIDTVESRPFDAIVEAVRKVADR